MNPFFVQLTNYPMSKPSRSGSGVNSQLKKLMVKLAVGWSMLAVGYTVFYSIHKNMEASQKPSCLNSNSSRQRVHIFECILNIMYTCVHASVWVGTFATFLVLQYLDSIRFTSAEYTWREKFRQHAQNLFACV